MTEPAPDGARVHVVDPLLVQRVVKRHRPVGFQIPHDHCYALPTDELLAILQRSELPADLGGSYLGLVARTDDARETARRRFHIEVHLEVRKRLDTEPDEAVHERIAKLGRTEFDAVRAVLLEENLLVPPFTDAAVWEEFVAQFLELLHFSPSALPGFFPTLRDLDATETLCRAEVDLEAILDRTGPIPSVELPEETGARQATPVYARSDTEARTFLTLADDAARRGNQARAAILRTRARASATDALFELGCRLSMAVPSGPEPGIWADALEPLLPGAGSGYSPVESRLLADLQRVAEAAERESYELDPVGWGLSRFQSKLLRPLPGQRLVQGIRYLRSARRRIPSARIDGPAAARLTETLRTAERCATEQGRAYFEPRIGGILDDELPEPANLPEQVAQRTLVQRLVDRLLTRGFLTIGDLRDALSGSQRKLPDLTLRDFIFGDALLRIDRRLTRELDGAYRRGEIYMRLLLRLSSLFFGTPPGRVVTLFGSIPFGGAYVILSGLEHMVNPALKWLGGPHIPFLTWTGVAILGAYLLAVIHITAARAGSLWLLHKAWAAVTALFWTGPRWLYRRPLVQAFLKSGPGRFAVRYIARPLVPTLLIGWIAPVASATIGASAGVAAGLFVVANGVMNSRFGRRMEDRVTVWAAVQVRFWRHHLVPGLIELALAWSRRALDAMERVFYRVDEFLRYRSSDTRLAMVGKALLGLVWGAVTYVVRIYVNLLIEPQVNPIKHFPVVTVSHKIILPFTVQLTTLFALPLRPFVGPVIANTIAGPTVVLLPGVFGFLVWELKENWRLYEANRPKSLRPVIIGHHGETMLSLMKPGFHSGTLPRLYRQLRHASARGNERKARTRREGLREVRHALETFVDRQFIPLLTASGAVRDASTHEVILGSNRVQIAVDIEDSGRWSVDFEEHGGWLMMRVQRPENPGPAAEAVELALQGVCRLTGVDLLAADVEAIFPAPATYDLTEAGLTVWPKGRWDEELTYPLQGRRVIAPVIVRGDAQPHKVPAADLLVRHRPMTWTEWVDRWDQGSGSTEASAR